MTDFDKKLDEYIILGLRTGFFNTEVSENIYRRIREVKIKEDSSLRGDARTDFSDDKQTLIINPNRCYSKGDYYLDEVLFHELSHFSNDIHRDLYIYSKSRIKEFAKNYNRYSYNDLTRFPEWGMFLLDEVIAQYTSQEMVKEKYGNAVKDIYKGDFITTHLTEPPVAVYTKLTDYKECYSLAEDFSKTVYHSDDNIKQMCIDAFSDLIIDKIFLKYLLRENGKKELYELLGYMGNVLMKTYEEKYGYTIEGSEPNRDKKLVLTSMRRVKDKVSQMVCE